MRKWNLSGRYRRRHGVSLILITISMVALLGFCSLAVDLGRVQAVKTQLEIACDAAARAGVANLSSGWSAVQSAAYNEAKANSADGTPVYINSNANIVLLDWPTTTALSTTQIASANAVQVTASEKVPLLFAQVLGMKTSTVHAISIAKAPSTQTNFQLVGLNGVTMSGNNTIDSYNSSYGSYYSQNPRGNGTIATNGWLNFGSSCNVNGDTWSGCAPGYSNNSDNNWNDNWGGGWNNWNNNSWGGWGNGSSCGTTHQLTSPITCSTPSVPSGCSNLGSVSCASGHTVTLTAGNYSCSGLNCSGTLKIDASSGPVNLYCTGPFTCGGTITTTGSIPSNFHVNMCCSSAFTLNGCDCYGCINAPASNVNVNNGCSIYGSCCGNNVCLDRNSCIHYDECLGPNGSSTSTIQQVR